MQCTASVSMVLSDPVYWFILGPSGASEIHQCSVSVVYGVQLVFIYLILNTLVLHLHVCQLQHLQLHGQPLSLA